MNAASLARKTKSTTYTPRQDSMGEGEVNGVCGKLNEVLKVTSELAVNKVNAETLYLGSSVIASICLSIVLESKA